MKRIIQNVILIGCGLILLAGIGCCFVDDSLVFGVLALGTLYVCYVVALVRQRKKEENKNKPPKGALRK